MANKNRDKGNRWELKVVKSLKRFFPKAMTSRAGDRSQDALGRDILNAGDEVLTLFVQCKATASMSLRKWFDHMQIPSEEDAVVFWKDTKHSTNQPEYVVVKAKTFYKLLKIIQKK